MALLDGFTHRTLEVNGIKIHLAEAGDGSAGTVLFLHGFMELWCSWQQQLTSLSRRGYRCLAPDLRGYGGSSAPASPASYTAFHLFPPGLDRLRAAGYRPMTLGPFTLRFETAAVAAAAIVAAARQRGMHG